MELKTDPLTAKAPVWMSCPKCDLKLQLEIRFGDDRFLCPRCDTTISVDNRDDGARDFPPFDPGVVIRAALIAAVASTVIIGLPVLVLDAAPSILEAMTRGSFVHWIVWLTTSFRRIFVVLLLTPLPGFLLALMISPYLHRYPDRWRRSFRGSFLFAGPVVAALSGFAGAAYHLWQSGIVPTYFLTGTLSVWLAMGYVAGTLLGIFWYWYRPVPTPSEQIGKPIVTEQE